MCQRARGPVTTAEHVLQRSQVLLGDRPNPGDVGVLMETLTRLGNLARLRGRYDTAERYLNEALQVAATHHAGGNRLAVSARNTLAITYKDSGRYAEAAVHYRDVLTWAIDNDGPDSPAVATLHHNLAGLAYAQGNYQEAEPLAPTRGPPPDTAPHRVPPGGRRRPRRPGRRAARPAQARRVRGRLPERMRHLPSGVRP